MSCCNKEKFENEVPIHLFAVVLGAFKLHYYMFIYIKVKSLYSKDLKRYHHYDCIDMTVSIFRIIQYNIWNWWALSSSFGFFGNSIHSPFPKPISTLWGPTAALTLSASFHTTWYSTCWIWSTHHVQWPFWDLINFILLLTENLEKEREGAYGKLEYVAGTPWWSNLGVRLGSRF